jgi:K+-sensing histidine kinase KdpD
MNSNTKTINNISAKKRNHDKYDYEKLSFLNHVSHGIRTPLNAIMGFSKLLVLKDAINTNQMKYLQGIINGGNLLMQFVDNLLDLSQFEAKNYKVNIKKIDINQIIWEFTEEFYNHKIENSDSDISLMLVWDSKVKDLEIETDPILFKKSIQRLINIVSKKYPVSEYELGYRNNENKQVCVFLRPALEKLNEEDFLDEHQLYSFTQDDSFDFFNFRVLSESIKIIKGELCANSNKQEYSFCIPLEFNS